MQDTNNYVNDNYSCGDAAGLGKTVWGITGHKGVGKSTIAQGLYKRLLTCEIMQFSAHLKKSLAFLLGVDDTVILNSSFIEKENSTFYGKSIRLLLQLLGTDFVRDTISKNFWVDIVEKRILSTTNHVVIDDVRFNNEADMIHKLGGKVILVRREGYFGDSHISEAGIDLNNVDYIFDNVGDKAVFQDVVVSTLYS